MVKFQKFPRQANDSYDTPAVIADIVLPHLDPGKRYIEPCACANALANRLSEGGISERLLSRETQKLQKRLRL